MDTSLSPITVEELRSSVCIAPLSIVKEHTRTQSESSKISIEGSSLLRSQGQPSPPLTPRSSRDALDQISTQQSVFHNYIRAFYPFYPTSDISSTGDESSITISINQGDVILVHSIHPNGWADGTLVADGSRGWLPTNYCEAYDPPAIHNLLTSLTHLWDLVRMGENGDLTAFSKQDYIRGMISGVRSLLDACQCLTREDALIQSHTALRRCRKGMLADLSVLVKVAKKLQAVLLNTVSESALYDLLDELVFKALKLINRAVRFLDLWQQHQAALIEQFPSPSQRPITPPKDLSHRRFPSTGSQSVDSRPISAQDSHAVTSPTSTAPLTDIPEDLTKPRSNRSSRATTAASPLRAGGECRRSFTVPDVNTPGARSSLTHRVSYTSKSTTAVNPNLALQQLCTAHDEFLGFIGSFIGLHLQSRSTSELLNTTKQSVLACSRLLNILDAVAERDLERAESLFVAKSAMNARLLDLVYATKALFTPANATMDDEVFMADEGKELVAAATTCVRAAGDCVSKTRNVLEIIGDFEYHSNNPNKKDSMIQGLESARADASAQRNSEEPKVELQEMESPKKAGARSRSPSLEKPLPSPPQTAKKLTPAPIILANEKPLPHPPLHSPFLIEIPAKEGIVESPSAMSFRSTVALPSQLPVPTSSQLDFSPTDTSYSVSPAISTSSRFFGKAFHASSINISVADSSSIDPNSVRGDNASIVSHTSTRATTPDQLAAAQTIEEPHPLKRFDSISELASTAFDDGASVEARVLEKSFVHELVYNKEGQISGGSLPALVEQLTLHDVTPDATFVTTFYLTFRLFTTPVEFVNCLIDRFEYIGDSKEVGLPVRLRVFNVLKGWLESHWNHDTDHGVLEPLLAFATECLRTSLPAAGKRILELIERVTAQQTEEKASQLTSVVGKTSTSIAVYSSVEKDAPVSIVTKTQLNLLKNARAGSSLCSILDFDALELARQFTIIESKIFCDIQPSELLALEWTKKEKSDAVNVRAMSTLSTDLTNLVADSILCIDDAKKRALTIKRWIKIGMRCLELHNYDSLMAIICSLNSSMVLRLKKTWELVSEKTKARLQELETIVNVSRNYAVLRQRLQNHIAPCIPFVGLYLTDLTFVDVGNRTKRELPDAGVSVINFDKHAKTAKIIGQLQQFQVPYKLNPVPEMQEWINSQIMRVRSCEQSNMKEYYRRSLLLEPREPQQIPKFNTQESNTSTASSGTTPTPTSTTKERFDFMGAFSFAASSAPRKRSTSN